MANNQQVRVDLQFKGDMSDVEKKLQQLQNTLSGITSGKSLNNLTFGSELNKAIGDATKLQAILKNTTMANGNLDLTKFRSELQKSGLTVKELGNSLLSLGPQGSQAFSQLTQSIINAEVPLKRTSTLLSNFATTLKNTAKWQISSSILHGFMSSVSSAYNYAQDLNESLNNIRIVSKQNTDQMAEFAQEANKAAKELSVTTTAYTDAALIFYQQGLEGDAVTERTDVVAKMSNVTKDSVDEVSSYMTAIWNNFDDGSQSLEHYADVITGLGAATASSSAEIAAGLEKFAAVADTVGLSYDYATSALATVVAQTRQSADTVGTAFKTLFARIEGLKLGETLEDGVDLNKYSEALAKIGVNVLDANGQLRDMDNILDDMGTKWGQISKAQQVAIAQTVAGTRQYNQLVALMDNWDKVQDNLQIARSSDGELQAQADIYAESWEAAQKRVRAAWESIYSSLFDDKFFIKLTNGLGSFIEGIDKVIKSLGGLKGILPIITAGLINLFNKDIANGINNFVYNLQIGTKKTQNELIEFKEQFSKVFQDFTTSDSFSSGATADAMANQASFQQAILDKQRELNAEGKDFSETEKMINNLIAERISLVNEEMINTAKETESLQEQLQVAKQKADLIVKNHNLGTNSEIKTINGKIQNLNSELNMSNSNISYQEIIEKNEELQILTEQLRTKMTELIQPEDLQELQQLQEGYGALSEQYKIFVDTLIDQGPEAAIGTLEKIKDTAIGLGLNIGEDTEAFEVFENVLNNLKVDAPIKEQQEAMLKLADIVDNLGAESIKSFENIAVRLRENKSLTEEDIKALQQYFDALQKVGKANINSSRAKFNANAALKTGINVVQSGSENKDQVQKADIGANFANATKAAMNFGSALNSVNTLIDKLMDNEASFGDKMLAVLTNGSMAIMMMGNSFKAISSLITPIVKNIELLTTNEEVLNTLGLKTLTIKKAEKAELEQQLAVETSLTSKKEIEKEIETINLTIEKLQTKEGQKQLAGEIILSSYKEGEVGFMTALLAISKLQTAEDKKQLTIALLKEGIKKLGQNILKGIKFAVDGIVAGVEALAGFLGVSVAFATALLAVVAAIAVAVVAVYKNYKNDLKTVAEEDRKHLDTLNKKRVALEEEAEQVQKLSEEYKNLIETQNDLSPEELKSQVYNLCIQYGEEELAVKALAGAYNNLDQAIANMQKENAEELKTSAERTKNAAKGSARSNAIVAAGSRADNFGDTIDLEGLGATFSNTDNGRLKTALQGLGLDIDSTGHVDTDQLISAILKDSEAFQKVIESSDAKAAETLQHIYDAISNEIGIYESSNNNLKQVIAAAYDTDSINSIQDYINAINNLAHQGITEELFTGDNAEEEARKWAKQALNGVSDEIDKFAQKNTIIEALVGPDASDELKNKVAQTLDSLPKEVTEESIAANIDFIKILGNGDIEKGIQKFANRFKELIAYNTTVALGEGLKAGLTSEEKLSESEVSNLYNLGFNPSGISQEQFNNLDLDQQKLLMTNFYMSIQDLSEETKNKIISDLESQINDLTDGFTSSEEAIAHHTKQIEEAETHLNNTLTDISEWAAKEYKKEWTEAYIERLAAAEDELTKEEKANEEFMKDREKLSEYSQTKRGGRSVSKDINNYKDQISESKTYINALKELGAELNSIKSGSIDLVTVQQSLNEIMKSVNEKTDNIQQAFQNLNDTVAEYNENGFVTMDTLQKLWQMDNQYLASLELVDGQLKLNENTFEVLANAQIDTMEAEALLQLQTDLLTDSENAEANTASAIAAGASSKIGSLSEVIAKVKEGTAAWQEYAKTQAAALGVDVTLPGKQEAIDAFYNKISLAESFRNQIGTKNFKTAMNVKSSKGSGGKGKDKETKELKEYADEFDRFYPYQKVIDDLADAMSDLAKEQEHMAGGELIGSLRKQNRLLEEQKKAYQDLAKEQKKYQKEMQTDLAKYGMSFDIASGNIVNYAQSTQAMLDQYNAAIEKYNKSAQGDADKKTLEAVEKEYEKFKKLVSDYQGILTEIQDTENNLDDIYYETIANNLKEFEIMVQVNLDIKEAERTVNDFINKINKNFKTLRKSTEEWMSVFDNALKNAHTYVDGEYSTISVDLDALNKVKSAIDSGDYGHEGAMFASETEAIMKYKELSEQLKDDAEELYELYTDAWSEYLDAIDEAIESWEELLDEFDNINDTLDHYEKLIELLHNHQSTDQGYDELVNLYDKQLNLQIAKQTVLRKQIDVLQGEYRELIAKGANENDEDVKKITAAIKEANKSLNDSIEAYVETLNKAFTTKVEKANKDSMKAALGFDPDQLSEDWDRAKKAQEGYYDETERIYQLDKLRRKYTDAINNTDEIKLKQKLAKLQQEELKRLEEKNELSEADIAIAEKKLAVEQARIALEEAQNNKSTMRLQRDSQGNWSYQFVANEEDLSQKQQDLMDAESELYETAKKANEDCVETIRQLWQEWHQERLDIINDETLNEEQKLIKLQELDAYYVEQISLRAESLRDYRVQLNEATADLLLASYQVNEENYRIMTEKQKELVDELRDRSIEDTTDIATATLDAYTKIQEKAEEVNRQSIDWWNQLTEVTEIDTNQMREANENFYNRLQELIYEYDEAIRRSEEASGIAWSNIQQAIEETRYAIEDVTNKVQECIDRSDDLSRFRDRLNEIEQAWYSVKDSITNALNELNSYLERLRDVKEMQDKVKQNETSANDLDLLNTNSDGKSNDGGGSASPSSTSTTKPSHYEMYGSGVGYGGMSDTANHTYSDIRSNASYHSSNNNATKVSGKAAGSYVLSSPTVVNNYELEKKKINGSHSSGSHRFATGGYTGEWGDEARWALLDQKELVLNQTDTSNILEAVKAIRGAGTASGITEAILNATNELASALSQNINSFAAAMLNTMRYISENPQSSALEQNVHIDASFPNVQNSREIEDAFNNLVNIASQRISYK